MNRFHPFRAPADEGAPGAAGGQDDPAAAATAAAAAAAAAAVAPPGKWWDAPDYAQEDRDWLAARGLTEDDPLKAMPKMVKGHRNAEQRLGRGVETILDKPAQGQSVTDWLAANRAGLGLPDKEEGYAIAAPDFWPKDEAWDTELAAKAQKLAFEKGVPPEFLKEMTALYAGKMKGMIDASAQGLAAAQAQMMADLRRDFGTQTEAVITRARQATEVIGQGAGMTPDQLMALSQTLSEKIGDANVIKFMNVIAEKLGEDTGIGMGKGGALTTTPAEARAQLAAFTAPGSEWYNATAEGNAFKVQQMRPTYEALAKLAAG